MATDGMVASTQLWHLDADIPPDGAESPVVLVRWEYDNEEALKALLRDQFLGEDVPVPQRVLKPHMLLVVRHKRSGSDDYYHHYDQLEDKRYLVPLSERAAYVGFKGAGENEVVGMIVNIPNAKVSVAADTLVHQEEDIFYRGSLRPYYADDVPHLAVLSTVMVPVDEALFPPEPPAWARKFVGCFFWSRPFDQCQFWRRFTWSLLLTLPALTLVMAARIATLLAALVIGFRDIPWGGLNPFNFHEWPWPDSPRDTVYFQRENGDLRIFAPAIFCIHPIVIVVATMVAYAAYGAKHWGLLWTLAHTAVGLLVVFVVLSLTTVIVMVIAAIVSAIRRAFRKQPDYAEQARVEQERQTAALQASVAQLDALITSESPAPTLRLRVGAFKRTHCRPYARK